MMCGLIEIDVGNNKICKVADIKKSQIINIIESAGCCPVIDKIILFGSALEERCTLQSDIDIAVFGGKPRYQALRSKEYQIFASKIYAFGDFQDYDILYFQSGKHEKSDIMKNISEGAVIYQRSGGGK